MTTKNQKALSQETYATVIRKHISVLPNYDQINTIDIMIDSYEQRLERGYKRNSEFVNKKEWLTDITNKIEAYKQIKAEIRAERIEAILARKEQ